MLGLVNTCHVSQPSGENSANSTREWNDKLLVTTRRPAEDNPSDTRARSGSRHDHRAERRRWNPDRLDALIADATAADATALWIFGRADNAPTVLDRFDAVFLLDVDPATAARRMTDPARATTTAGSVTASKPSSTPPPHSAPPGSKPAPSPSTRPGQSTPSDNSCSPQRRWPRYACTAEPGEGGIAQAADENLDFLVLERLTGNTTGRVAAAARTRQRPTADRHRERPGLSSFPTRSARE
jgi:hypothetical protein